MINYLNLVLDLMLGFVLLDGSEIFGKELSIAVFFVGIVFIQLFSGSSLSGF